MDLSIILINYNKKELTEQTIQSVFSTVKHIEYEIIVIDNSSCKEQQYTREHPLIKTYLNVQNKGFGNACNLGASYSNGDYLLFLNNDTILHEGTLDTTVEYCKQHPEIGALGVRTLLADGTLDHGCKRGFPTPMNSLYYFSGMDRRHPESKKYGAYRQTFVKEDTITEVDSVSGSYLLMPKQVFEQIDGFDDDYFMYGEDLDLCYRVKQNGYQVVYYGQASMTHLKGQSGLNTNPAIVNHFYQAMVLFYNKHYRKKYNCLTNGIVLTGIRLKKALALRQMKKRKQTDG